MRLMWYFIHLKKITVTIMVIVKFPSDLAKYGAIYGISFLFFAAVHEGQTDSHVWEVCENRNKVFMWAWTSIIENQRIYLLCHIVKECFLFFLFFNMLGKDQLKFYMNSSSVINAAYV